MKKIEPVIHDLGFRRLSHALKRPREAASKPYSDMPYSMVPLCTKSIFLDSDEDEVNEFFTKLATVPHPQKERAFITACMKNSLTTTPAALE